MYFDPDKGGPVEERLYKKASQYSKFEFYLTGKHWLSWLPVTEKLREQFFLKGKQRVKGKENSNVRFFFIKPFFHWATFTKELDLILKIC